MLSFPKLLHLVRFDQSAGQYHAPMQRTITLIEAIRDELTLWRSTASDSMLGPDWSTYIDRLCDDMATSDCKQPNLALAELMRIIRRFGVVSPRIAAPSIAALESHIRVCRA